MKKLPNTDGWIVNAHSGFGTDELIPFWASESKLDACRYNEELDCGNDFLTWRRVGSSRRDTVLGSGQATIHQVPEDLRFGTPHAFRNARTIYFSTRG
jgi:hypothetical protein